MTLRLCCSREELSGSLRERTILQFERGGQFGILVVADHSISDIVAEHDPVFVAVPGAAAEQPDVCQLRVPIDDEVIVDAVFALMKRLFPSYQNLLKAHIDYLLMTGLLMIFFLLFNHFRVSPSPLVVFAMSVGSFMNPVAFIA